MTRSNGRGLSRRRFLTLAGATAGALAVPELLVEKALSVEAAGGSLKDIKHVVILMQENRSFDHYFGTMAGVRGFGDATAYRSYAGGPSTKPATVFSQTTIGPDGKPLLTVGGDNFLNPFELESNPPTVDGQTTNDITHDWGPQHLAWNNGAMDQWVVQHLKNDPVAKFQVNNGPLGLPEPSQSSIPTGITTMGYYRETDHLDFYRAIAKNFTICDGYFCSVIGPTDPNRLMWMSGSLGAHSADKGGPILTTYVQNRQDLVGTLDWPTMPELLTQAGVGWKVYQDPTSNALFNVLDYFKNFAKPTNPTQAQNAANGLAPVYPAEFAADVQAGTLPSVSWILPPAPCCEHPATPPPNGEYLVSQILQILVSNPEVWAQTVFLVVYDENGGFFDHVAPPTPGPTVTSLADVPAGANLDGEYLTTDKPVNAAGGPPSDWDNVLGPVGLGFRTPALVISPFSAGGFVCSDTFDHISTLKFIESVFLTPGTIMSKLHISRWRYSLVGDMTTALPVIASPTTTVPTLPQTSLLFPDVFEQNLVNSLGGTVDYGQAYPVPTQNAPVPAQDDPGPTKQIKN
ncbi:MAG TPA: alkaline phosphatase family protein [Acidimicrobiales bacterium]|nr:alkaline phosphatase family protein [Acidimicrobiales bacterium]